MEKDQKALLLRGSETATSEKQSKFVGTFWAILLPLFCRNIYYM